MIFTHLSSCYRLRESITPWPHFHFFHHYSIVTESFLTVPFSPLDQMYPIKSEGDYDMILQDQRDSPTAADDGGSPRRGPGRRWRIPSCWTTSRSTMRGTVTRCRRTWAEDSILLKRGVEEHGAVPLWQDSDSHIPIFYIHS
jgi:hypothetical protein